MATLIPYRHIEIHTSLCREDAAKAISDALRTLPPVWFLFLYPMVDLAGNNEYVGSVSTRGFRIQRLFSSRNMGNRGTMPSPSIYGKFVSMHNQKTRIDLVIKLPPFPLIFMSLFFGFLFWTLYVVVKNWITSMYLEIGFALGILFMIGFAYSFLIARFNDEANKAMYFVQKVIKSAERKVQRRRKLAESSALVN